MTGKLTNGGTEVKLPAINLNTILGILLLLVNLGAGYFVLDVRSGQDKLESKVDATLEKLDANKEADAKQQTEIELLKLRNELNDELQTDGNITTEDIENILLKLKALKTKGNE